MRVDCSVTPQGWNKSRVVGRKRNTWGRKATATWNPSKLHILNKWYLEPQNLALGRGPRTVVPFFPIAKTCEQEASRHHGGKGALVSWQVQHMMHNNRPGSARSVASSAFSYCKVEQKQGRGTSCSHPGNMDRVQGLQLSSSSLFILSMHIEATTGEKTHNLCVEVSNF